MTSGSGETYPCSHCYISYLSKDSLRKHILSHTGETYPCSHCYKSYLSKDSLRKLILSHTGETYPCSHCYKSYVYVEGFLQKAYFESYQRNFFKMQLINFAKKLQYSVCWERQELFSHIQLKNNICTACNNQNQKNILCMVIYW